MKQSFMTSGPVLFQYGLEMFNASSEYLEHHANFGDKKIGLIVLDSCWNNLTIARKILDLHVSGITLENGQRLDLSDRIIGKLENI